MVATLFTESMWRCIALQAEWERLNAMGIDTSQIQQQFTRLLGWHVY